MHKKLILRCVLLLVIPPLTRAADIHNVCELLRDPEALSGKVVKVRGMYFATSEASSIQDKRCRDPIDLKGQQWSPGISIAVPDPRSASREGADFNGQAFKMLVRTRTEAERNGEVVVATFEGRLEYCLRFGTLRTGRRLWIGCVGPGGFILRLVVKTVDDIRTEPKPN